MRPDPHRARAVGAASASRCMRGCWASARLARELAPDRGRRLQLADVLVSEAVLDGPRQRRSRRRPGALTVWRSPARSAPRRAPCDRISAGSGRLGLRRSAHLAGASLATRRARPAGGGVAALRAGLAVAGRPRLTAGSRARRYGVAALALDLAGLLVVRCAPDDAPGAAPGRRRVAAQPCRSGSWPRRCFGLYLTSIADYGSVFGSLAAIFVVLVYLYFSSVVFRRRAAARRDDPPGGRRHAARRRMNACKVTEHRPRAGSRVDRCSNGGMSRSVRLLGAAVLGALTFACPAAAAVHTVVPGETLSGIAAANGLTTARSPPPTAWPRPRSPSPARRCGSRPRAARPRRRPAAATPADGAPAGGHLVTPGETLSGIAAANGLTTRRSPAANGLTPTSFVIAGTQLRIPAAGAPTTAAATRGAARARGDGRLHRPARRHARRARGAQPAPGRAGRGDERPAGPTRCC